LSGGEGGVRSYAKVLREAMDRQGIGCTSLARATGMSRQSVRGYLIGACVPAPANAYRIAEALDNIALYGLAVRVRSGHCKGCGVGIVSQGTARLRVWCNTTCRDRWRRDRRGRSASPERRAIAAMCKSCEPEGACSTSTCPLRAWSPLPLRPDAVALAIPTVPGRRAWTQEQRAAASARQRGRKSVAA
jgi:hypothetical protein